MREYTLTVETNEKQEAEDIETEAEPAPPTETMESLLAQQAAVGE